MDMDVERPGGLTAKHGYGALVELGTFKVRRNATRCYEVGTIFEEADGFYTVSQCCPVVSVIGPRWDIYLRRASPDLQLAVEVMLT